MATRKTRTIRLTDDAIGILTTQREEMLAQLQRLERSQAKLLKRIKAMNEILGPPEESATAETSTETE